MKKYGRRIVLLVLAVFCMLGISSPKKVQASAKVQSLVVIANKEGLRPSYGNYALIKTSLASSQSNVNLRVRVVNTQGKYLYQKKFTNIKGNRYVNIKWNGRAIAGNEMGLAAGQCPGTGTYRVEALAYYTSGGVKVYSKKTASIRISYVAPSGKAALSNTNSVAMMTGDKSIDYLAEVMCNAAGVTSTMTQDQKVKKIYHWISYNFHHVHYSLSSSYKKYYNLSALSSKISAYRSTVNKQITAGTAIFNYNTPTHISWNMERRIGVCTDHARVFKILCNHVGVEAEICHGYYLNRNGTRTGHYWNSAVINGTTYYYDVDVELQNLGGGQGDYYWYKKTRSEAEKTHLFQ